MTGSETPPGRLPDFFIAGHAKSGTTALYEMLRRHPQIYMPEEKEPWFFAEDMRPRFTPRMAGVAPESLAEYATLFAAAGPEQKAGEASSSYLWSRTAARAIAQVIPQARIIAILREPSSFLRSLHLQLLQTHVEDRKSLREAVGLEAERREGRQIPTRSHRPQLLQYADHVRYVEQLRRYHEVFGHERVLVLIYEEFRRDNEGTVKEVLRFLGVDEQIEIGAIEANPTVQMRSQRLDEVVHALSTGKGSPLARGARAAVKAVTPTRLRRDALRFTQRRVVHARPEPADEQFLAELKERFRGEVEALGEYLGRDMLALWGYGL
jgi:Sulfotransferase family